MDWALTQDYNRVVITPASPESIGAELAAWGAAAPSSVAWPTANRAIYVPFLIYQPLLAQVMATFNGTSSGNLDVGIYDDQGDRLVSSGSTVMAGTAAVQTLDIADTLLEPGVYYMAMAVSNTTATVRRAYTNANGGLATLSAMGVLSQATALPLPATATFATPADNYIPDLALFARTVV